MGYHTVEQGEHLAGIAYKFGFTDYRKLFDHPNNAELKKNRPNPNVLFPGDLVFIPDKQSREESRPTDKRHTFKTSAKNLKLRVVLEDQYEEPIANAKCLLTIDGNFRDVLTDGKGKIEQEIPQDAEEAVLVIRDPQTPLEAISIAIRIGHLDPVEETSGQEARLNNLGYSATGGVEKDPDALRSAIEEFQCDHGLTVDGICGTKTQNKLKEVHGC